MCTLLGVVSALAIIAFINHSLRRMQIDSVVRRIADHSNDAIARHLARGEHQGIAAGLPPQGESGYIKAESGGWAVAIDEQTALETLPGGSTCRVDVLVGEAVSAEDTLLTVWPDPGGEWKGARRLRDSIVTATERSVELDPTFGIPQ